MTRYIFHGGGTAADGGDSFYQAALRDIRPTDTVLVCYFASRSSQQENEHNLATVRAKIRQITGHPGQLVLMANQETFLSQVCEAAVIMFRGGSTEQLINTLKQYPTLADLLSGKTVSGSSAGAYALATYYSSHYEAAAAPGLGIAAVRMVTHFAGKKMQPHPEAIVALESTAPELPLIKLREGEWVECTDKG